MKAVDYLREFANNRVLWAAIGSWIVAQILKMIINLIVTKKFDIKRLFGDGGMPSGHSATVTALVATSARAYGLGSFQFAIAGVLAIIVMHDAMTVRYEAGKHAKALNNMEEFMQKFFPEGEWNTEKQLKEFLGHTPFQVICGALLGLLIGLLIPIA